MQLFTIRTSSVITKTKLKVLDILGCSPKLSYTFSLVAISYGGPLVFFVSLLFS